MATAMPKDRTDRSATRKLPELWMLWSDAVGWLEAEDIEGDPKLAYLCEDDADIGAAYHQAEFGIDCTPVNVLAR